MFQGGLGACVDVRIEDLDGVKTQALGWEYRFGGCHCSFLALFLCCNVAMVYKP